MKSIVRVSAVILLLIRYVWGEDTAVVTLDRNPVYSGEPVVITCSYGDQKTLAAVTVDAFNRTQKQGFLWCRVPSPNTTSDGVFSENTFLGCPSVPSASTNVSLRMIASPSRELDYNCSVVVTSTNYSTYTLSSAPTSLVVNVLPEIPRVVPNPVVFNKGDTAKVFCESRHGKPAAAVRLIVSSPDGSLLQATGNDSASLLLPLPLKSWHNGTATCTVTNHEFSNKTSSCAILINSPEESKHTLRVILCTLAVIAVAVGVIGLVWVLQWWFFIARRRSSQPTDVDGRDDKIAMTENDLYATAAAQPARHTKEHA